MPVTTELRWDGKYDAHGKRVMPLKVQLPFQTVETINEPTPERRTLFQGLLKDQRWRNRLIWGDKKYVLPSLLGEFAGKVNLIYIDPPFDTGADFSFNTAVPEAPDDEEADPLSFTKQPSIIEQKAYRDTWGRGIDSYLQWFYDTVVLLHELLAEDGSLYVHLDWHVCHYAKIVLDEVFGSDRFINEIIWKRKGGSANPQNRFGIVTDSLLVYSKSPENYTFQPTFTRESDEAANYIKERFRNELKGRRYMLAPIERNAALGVRSNLIYDYKGYVPKYGWMMNSDKLRQMDQEDKLHWNSQGKPNRRVFLDEYKGQPIENLWTDIYVINPMAGERLEYPTQKPQTLLERIIKTSSNEGDLVLDCFCGSGTTAAVAEKLTRRWIACDLGRFAIHTTRKRLLNTETVRPFVMQNLGKYERQHWQTGQFAVNGPETAVQAARRHQTYIDFMLKLYGAQPLTGQTWLHGVKNGRMVHIGGVDGPVSDGDIRQIAAEFKRLIGSGKNAPTSTGVDVLGWDFAFELNEVARQQAEKANLDMRFRRIPRDVMDKRAVAEGDIHFFELASLALEVQSQALSVSLRLTSFVIPPDDVPEDVRTAVKHWSQWIDYWAVDWDYDGQTFHNQWQSFRTRGQTKLTLAVAYSYPKAGHHKVMVKVIDILGNDTTTTLSVDVKDEDSHGQEKA